ncbi:Hypothetical predicted protein, partial [Pelobates cultripes]
DLVTSKRHWKGSGPAPRKSKGKAPSKRSRQTERQGPSTLPLSSSDEEEHNTPPALEVMDEWKAEDSPSEEEDWFDTHR